MSPNNDLVTFVIMLGAGLVAAVGGAAVRFGSLQSPQFLSLSMALAAGVMLHVSYVDILTKSVEAFSEAWPVTEKGDSGPKYAVLASNVMLFMGVIGIYLLGKAVDHFQTITLGESHADHHAPPEKSGAVTKEEVRSRHRSSMIVPDVLALYRENQSNGNTQDVEISEQASLTDDEKAKLMRTSIVTAFASVRAHNLPEGIATFIALSIGTGKGLPLAVAIMIHNIPEGVCVAVPILYATGSRLKAFLIALAVGSAEPVGAAIGWVIISSVNHESMNILYGSLFGLVAGLMIYIALVELIPTAVA